MTFTELGLSAPLLRSLDQAGYTVPTPIQAQAIPPVLAGRDVLGIAQTGTGKTAAFALPILQRLAESATHPVRRGCRTLVLSPTRELASQIAENFGIYGRHLRLTTTVVFGGVSIGKQERALAGGVDILVATPGRLLDLVDRRSLTLGGVEILVLDEADQMLDLGFIHALRRITGLVPKQRQSLFFSATMPNLVSGLADGLLRDPIKVSVTPVATTAERVEQSVIFSSTGDKQSLLRAILSDKAVDRALVFTRTKHGADRVVKNLERDGIASAAIHGNKSQGQRERALADFKSGRSRVLVATDIAARGIDVEAVSHVVQFDLPNVPESYVHRIGRTARAGATGIAISFCNAEERAYLRDIEKLTRTKVPVAEPPEGFTRTSAADRVDDEPREERRNQPRGRGAPQGRGGRPAASSGRPAGGAGRPAGAKPQGNRARPSNGRPAGDRPRDDRRPASAPAAGRSQGDSGSDGRLAWLERARGPNA